MSGESTTIRDGCVAPHVSDPDDTMVGTLGPTETEEGASPREDDDAPAEHIGPEPEQLKRKSVGVPGYHHIRRTYPAPILSPRTKRPRLVPAKYDGGVAARADRASSPKVPPKPKDKKLTGIPGVRYIFRTRIGRYEVHIWKRKGERLKRRTRGPQNTYLGTVDTLEEAVEVYNKEARLLGLPTQEMPADYVAPEPDVPPTVTRAPKHTSSPNDKKKKKYTAVPGYRGIRESTSGRFSIDSKMRGCGRHDRLSRTVDTLREAVELFNMEAKKRGKPIQPLPDDDDKLDVPELNKISTVVPGLKGINMMTVDGKFMAQIYQGGQGFQVGNFDTLDDAVKEQNAAGAARFSEWVTLKITAEHRAVAKEMQRKREVFIPKPPKKRKMTARQHDKAPAPAIKHLRPRPEPAAEKARPQRAKTLKRPAGVAPAEMTSAGGAAAAAAAPAHLDESAELNRLREENEQLLEINESLLAMAQRVMGMAARMSQATQRERVRERECDKTTRHVHTPALSRKREVVNSPLLLSAPGTFSRPFRAALLHSDQRAVRAMSQTATSIAAAVPKVVSIQSRGSTASSSSQRALRAPVRRARRLDTSSSTRRATHVVAMSSAHDNAGMSDMERYLFDLNGFVVVRNVFTPDEIAAANAAIDARSDSIVERKGDLRLGGTSGDPLAGDGVTGRADLGGMLEWPAPDRDLFRDVLTHPKLVPYYHALVGEGYRMDHLPLLIQQAPGADGFVFHGGKMNDDGTWCDELSYTWNQGRMYNRLLAVSVALTRTTPGDGGFCVVRGSHKSNLPCPPSIQGYEEHRDLVDNPGLEPGDVMFFTEAGTHGTLPWTAAHTRRAALYRFAPATSAYGRAYLTPEHWGGLDDLTEAEKAVLAPPYHQRLDRPALTMEGTVAGQRRAEFKKEHDAKVFGSKYF